MRNISRRFAEEENNMMFKVLDSLCVSCSDAIVSQVLDELGLNLSDELSRKNNSTLLSRL